MSRSTGTFLAVLAGLVTGAAVGASFGILYAPDKGRNTRDRLTYQLDKYRDRLKELIDELVEGRDSPANDARNEGQRVINDAREKAERLLGDVEQLMGQIRKRS
jgi:gas vesicle protein